MERLKKSFAWLMLALLVLALLAAPAASAAGRTEITMSDPVVKNSSGIKVNAENLGFKWRGFVTSYALGNTVKDVSRETLNMNNDFIDWNTAGYEFLGWSIAGSEPLLGAVEIGTKFTRSEAHPVRKYVSQADASKEWNFTVFVSEKNIPYFYWTNVKFSEGCALLSSRSTCGLK